MKDSVISTILYVTGIVILILTHVYMLMKGKGVDVYIHTILVFPAIVFMIAAWIIELKVRKEKYDFDYALQSGRLVSGTVYSSNLSQVPGAGWIL